MCLNLLKKITLNANLVTEQLILFENYVSLLGGLLISSSSNSSGGGGDGGGCIVKPDLSQLNNSYLPDVPCIFSSVSRGSGAGGPGTESFGGMRRDVGGGGKVKKDISLVLQSSFRVALASCVLDGSF